MSTDGIGVTFCEYLKFNIMSLPHVEALARCFVVLLVCISDNGPVKWHLIFCSKLASDSMKKMYFYVISGKHVRAVNTPLNPTYVIKLGFLGVYLFFLILLQNIDCGYSLEPPRRAGSNVYTQFMF